MRPQKLILPAAAVATVAGVLALRGGDHEPDASTEAPFSRSVAADLAEPAPAVTEVQALFERLKITLETADAKATTHCPSAERQVRADDAGAAILKRDGGTPSTIQFVRHYGDAAKLQPLGYSAVSAMGLGSPDPSQPHVTVGFDISNPAALDCLNTHVMGPLNDPSWYLGDTICRVHYDLVNRTPPVVTFVVGCGPKDFENPHIGDHDPQHYWHIPTGEEDIR